MRLKKKKWGAVGLCSVALLCIFALVRCGDFYSPFGPGTSSARVLIEIPIAIRSGRTSLDLLASALTNIHMSVSGCSSGYAPTNFLFNGNTVSMYANDTGCVISLCSFTYNGESYPNQTPPCGTFNTSAGTLTSFTGTGGANPGGDTVYAFVSEQLASPITLSSTAQFYILENDDFGNTDLPITSNVVTVTTSSPASAPFTVAASTSSVSYLFSLLYPNPPPATALTVNYSMVGSAVAGADYTAPSGTITIPANSSSATLTVSLINNTNARESPLSLGVNIGSSSGFQGVSSYLEYGSPGVMITNTSTTIPTTSAGLVYQGKPTNFVQSGGHVTSWSDASGSGDGITFTGSGSPTYNATGLNGQATVGFSGSNFLDLTSNNNSLNSAGAGYTSKVVSMAFVTGSDVTTRQVLYEQGDATSGINIYIFNGLIYSSTWGGSGTDFNVSAYILPSTAYSVSLVYNFTNLVLQMYLSGVLVGQTAITTKIAKSTSGAAIGGNTGTTKFENGTTTTAVTGFTGQVAEYLHYNNPTLTATQIASIHGYLDAKYAMNTFPAVTVSAVHPSVGETNQNAPGFMVSRSIVTSSPLTVYYTMGGSAVAGTNYVALPGSVVIPAYNATVFTGIQGIYNSSPESTSTATLTLATTSSGGTTPVTYIGAPNTASLNIVAYAPPTSATLVSWLDGSSGITTAGGNVSAWVDKSGNAINATGATSHFPTSNSSGSPTFINFNGTSTANAQVFSLASNALLDSAASYTQKTFALVFKTGTTVTTTQVIYTQGNTTNGMNIVISGGNLYFTGYGTGWTTPVFISKAISASTLYDVIFEYDHVNNQMRGFLNGSVITPVTTGVGTLTGVASSTEIGSVKSATDGVRFFNNTTSTTAFADFLQTNFQLYEMILFNGILSSSDYSALHDYLVARYGI